MDSIDVAACPDRSSSVAAGPDRQSDATRAGRLRRSSQVIRGRVARTMHSSQCQ